MPPEPGATAEVSLVVPDERTADAMGNRGVRVFATPFVIALLEDASAAVLRPHLPAGGASVGTMIEMRHLAATPVGMTVTITVELTEIDRRRLAFRVAVRDELDEAGKGTHERFIVDAAQRMPRLQEKMNRWKAAGGKPA